MLPVAERPHPNARRGLRRRAGWLRRRDLGSTQHHCCRAGHHPVAAELRADAVLVGARFHPGTPLSWLGIPLNEILNSRLPLREFWKSDVSPLAGALSRLTDPAAIGHQIERTLTLHRILRFQGCRNLALRPDRHHLVEMAFEAGYADQANLSREARQLGGLNRPNIWQRFPANRLF
jgi:hypothetical protein